MSKDMEKPLFKTSRIFLVLCLLCVMVPAIPQGIIPVNSEHAGQAWDGSDSRNAGAVSGRYAGLTAFDWSEAVIASSLEQFSPETFDGWHYATALFLEGLYRTWNRTGNYEYIQFFSDWADLYIDEAGNIDKGINRLDDILPGIVALHMYHLTADEKYKKAATTVRKVFDTYPRTSEGGLWHMKKKQNELWLDGLYMSMPFLVRYGKMFGEEEYCYSEAIHQFKTYASHLQDEETGLLYHAFDEDGSEFWAKPPENHSEEFWGRSIGWFAMALVEVLEIIPPDFDGRNDLLFILQEILYGLVEFQDEDSGLWYQVVNKGHLPGNWVESSCSIMYTYAITRAVQLDYVDDSLAHYAQKGYDGVMTMMSIDAANRTKLIRICEGTGVGDYDFYINRARLENNNHGLGAFLIMNELFTHNNIYIDDLQTESIRLNNPVSETNHHGDRLYPNPVSTILYLEVKAPISEHCKIEVMSVSGTVAYRGEIRGMSLSDGIIAVDTEQLAPGIWFIRLCDTNSVMRTFSFSKL
jgi:unsaturated rhamnogalacturonyl hydrolase